MVKARSYIRQRIQYFLSFFFKPLMIFGTMARNFDFDIRYVGAHRPRFCVRWTGTTNHLWTNRGFGLWVYLCEPRYRLDVLPLHLPPSLDLFASGRRKFASARSGIVVAIQNSVTAFEPCPCVPYNREWHPRHIQAPTHRKFSCGMLRRADETYLCPQLQLLLFVH